MKTELSAAPALRAAGGRRGNLIGALWAVALLAGGVLSPGAQAAGDATRERLEAVAKLVEVSSAARKIKASDNAAAKAGRAEAVALYEQAREAFAAGDSQLADDLLHRATETLFSAVRQVELDQSVVDKRNEDYQARRQSIEALLAAYGRIREEKLGPRSGADKTQADIARLSAEAEKLREAGDLPNARKRLDEAYLVAKTAIEKLRGGDTLVRSLHFETKEDEYRYELDRNDTHRMLVDVLLKDKMRASSGVQRMVKQFMGKADELRKRAEAQAGAGQFDAAVQTLEDSTKEIVRAIRSAGVYIPG